jgi:predicted O-linked N-acetylglucosamine transferase (SPINDLY family)
MSQPHADVLATFRIALEQGRSGDALAAEEKLAALPQVAALADAWYQAGHFYVQHWRFADAERALARAAALAPGEPAIQSIRATARQELGDTAGALAALEQARRDPPDLRVESAHALMLPQVYESPGDVARWRARYEQGLARLEGLAPRLDPREVFALDRGNFLLAYQGGDDLPLQRRYSRLLASMLERAEPRWRAPRGKRTIEGRRIRVGFVGSIFRDCTAGRYFERWATGLDRARFERIVFHTAPVSDGVSARIAAGVDAFVPLRDTIHATARHIEEAALDAIVYPEVGMDAMTYVLAALRLAPVQLAGWGHPVTTGSDAIDAFISSGPMEPADGQSHYAEPLLRLPGIGVDYALPVVPEGATRAAFSLPANRRLYACPQSLFKIHPDMDAAFAELLASDEDGVLVFFQATSRAVTEAFARRVQGALAARGVPPRGQLKFLPRMGGRDFRALLSVADVVLDTAHWSGGNTSLDAFAAATPVVTTNGRFMRGRQTAAMLAMMRLPSLVAPDLARAVATAIEVASQPDLRRQLSQAIVERRTVLFSRAEPVAALGAALHELTAGNPGGNSRRV